MAKFIVLPDGQIVAPDAIVAVKKVTFNDGERYVRLVLSGSYGFIDILCADELQHAQMLKDTVDIVLRHTNAATETASKH